MPKNNKKFRRKFVCDKSDRMKNRDCDSGLEESISSNSMDSLNNITKSNKKVKWLAAPAEYYAFLFNTDCLTECVNHGNGHGEEIIESYLTMHLKDICEDYCDYNFDCLYYSVENNDYSFTTLKPRLPSKSTSEFNNLEDCINKFSDTLNFEPKEYRSVKKRKHMKIHKAVKSKYITDFRHNDKKSIYINHRIYKRLLEVTEAYEDIRRNVFFPDPVNKHKRITTKERKAKAKIELKNVQITRRIQKIKPTRTHALKKSTNSISQKDESVLNPHQLVEVNAPDDLEDAMVTLLIELQHREVTPEDYDLLLRLDDSVKPKTVSLNVVDNLDIREITEELLEESPVCAVCMELYIISDFVKCLPCQHFFHVSCINQWLTNSSPNCPLDGQPIC